MLHRELHESSRQKKEHLAFRLTLIVQFIEPLCNKDYSNGTFKLRLIEPGVKQKAEDCDIHV
jgi:hypothetical protein